MSNLNLGIIGNCSFAALVNTRGRIVWASLPHFDGDPFFGSLLHEPALDDPEARGFYEKCGYRVIGQLDEYPPGGSFYWMRKDL